MEQQERLLRLPEVLKLIPVSRSSWWNGVKSGKYPAGRKLSERTTVWLYSSVMALIDGVKHQGV